MKFASRPVLPCYQTFEVSDARHGDAFETVGHLGSRDACYWILQIDLERRRAAAMLEMQEQTLRLSRSMAERQASFEQSQEQSHSNAMLQVQEQITSVGVRPRPD